MSSIEIPIWSGCFVVSDDPWNETCCYSKYHVAARRGFKENITAH